MNEPAQAGAQAGFVRRYVFYMAGFHACRGLVNSTLVLYLVDTLGLSLGSTGMLLAIDLVATLLAEIPTGVYADIRGRGRSFFLACVLSCMGYAVYGALPVFSGGGSGGASLLLVAAAGEVALSIGFAFYSGALDAWIVDALSTQAGAQPLGRVLARGQTWKNLSYMGSGVLGVALYHAMPGRHVFNGFLLSALLAGALAVFSRRQVAGGGSQRVQMPAATRLAVRSALAASRAVLSASARHVLEHRPLFWVVIAGGPCFALIQVLAYYWPYLLVKDMVRDATLPGSHSASALAVSWLLGYGARAAGNEAARKLVGSTWPRTLTLAAATFAGSLFVMSLVVLPLLPGSVIPLSWMAALSTLIYGAARFSDGMADPLRQWLLADLTEAQGRATQFSIASSFALAFSAVMAFAASAALNRGCSVWQILSAVALLQLASVPVYFMAGQWGVRNDDSS